MKHLQFFSKVNLQKRHYLTLLIICIVFILFIIYKLHEPKPRMNVLLISLDALRADHMGVYGYNGNTTPGIDKWAKDNVIIFKNAYTPVPMTYPSFAALMTGISPFESSIYRNVFTKIDSSDTYIERGPGSPLVRKQDKTLAEVLSSSGYSTTAYISSSVLAPSLTNLDRGFNTYQFKDYSYQNSADGAKLLTNRAISFLQDHSDTKNPFFLWLHYLDPHSPYTPDIDIACKINNKDCSVIKKIGLQELENERMNLQGCQQQELDNKTIEIYKTLYDGEIRSVDKLLTQIFSELQYSGLGKNTLVILYGDHGEGFDHNYYFTHSGLLYESQVHIPLLIRYPWGNLSSYRVSTRVENTQIFPTILKLIGVHLPAQNKYQEDFARVLTDRVQSVGKDQTIFFMNFLANMFAIRDGDYKYILTIAKVGEPKCYGESANELYNIKKDPEELTNLSKKMPETMKSMKKKLLDYIANKSFSLGNDEQVEIHQPKDDKNFTEYLRNLGY